MGRTRWRYPKTWLAPLKWYWETVSFPCNLDAVARRGVTWVELVTDFEISTRVMLNGKRTERGRANFAYDECSVAHRAKTFAHAARRIISICGGRPLPSTCCIGILAPYGARWLSGIPIRVNLINPEAVFLELADQALEHEEDLGASGDLKRQWQWQPNHRRLPEQAWHGAPMGNLQLPGRRFRITSKRPAHAG